MHRLSMMQVLSIWVDLEQARAKEHSYGGDIAEIYLYRAMQRRPSTEAYIAGGHRLLPPITGEDIKEDFRGARAGLLEVFTTFSKMRHARVEIEREKMDNYVEAGEWFINEPEEHRIHVRVRP